MREGAPGQALALQDAAGAVGESQLEYFFCQIDSDDRSMHDADSSRAAVTETHRVQCGPRGRVATWEESISSFKPTPLRGAA